MTLAERKIAIWRLALNIEERAKLAIRANSEVGLLDYESIKKLIECEIPIHRCRLEKNKENV